jgi:aminopeptidase N
MGKSERLRLSPIRRQVSRTAHILLLVGIASSSSTLAGAAPPHAFGDPAVTHRAPKRTYHVENYKLKLHFNQARGEVLGEEEITLKPLIASFTRFYLNSSELTIESVRLHTSRMLSTLLPFTASGSRLWIQLPRAYDQTDVLQLAIRYHGFPRAGLYFVNPSAAYPDAPREIWSQGEPEFNRFWFPCWEYPNDMSTSEMIVTVPAIQSVVSNGKLIGVSKRGNELTFDWAESVPHSSYLTSIAVGSWRTVHDHYGRLSVDYYVPIKVGVATALRSFHLTPDMIGFFSRALGVPYPYEKYSQVTISHYFFGGMENVSATSLTDATLHNARADPDYSSERLVSHELGQQWFGDFVQGRDWADIWLNEGFATYLEALYTQHHDGDASFRLQMLQDQEAAVRQDRNDYLRPIVDDHYTDPMQMFDSITHEKGAVVLDMLRNLIDGEAAASRPASQKELFFRALHFYLTKYPAQAVDTKMLVHAIEASTGQHLDWFFREWVYMAGHPDYRVAAKYHRVEKVETITVDQTQGAPGVPRVFVMPIQIAFYGANGQSRRLIIEDSGRSQSFEIPLQFTPLWVDFDPDDILEKNLIFVQPVQALALQAREDPSMMSRLYAVQQLGAVTGTNIGVACSTLAAALEHDAFYGVREFAAQSLGHLHTQAAKTALLAALTEPNSRVRIAVVRALAEFHDDSDIYKALLTELRNDPSYAVEVAAAEAIGDSGNSSAFSVLQQAAGNNADPHVMEGVYEGLAATGAPQAIVLLSTDARPGVKLALRLEALRALEHQSRDLSRSTRADLVNTVAAALDDSDLAVREIGEQVAGAWDLTELNAQITRLARTAPTRFERDAAREALRELHLHSAE